MSTGIGTRWTPGHVVRIDSVTGRYEEINPPQLSADALKLQQALLDKRLPLTLFGFVVGGVRKLHRSYPT